MQILTPLFVAMRARQLGRQFRDIERSIRALPKRNRDRLSMLTLREIGQASRCDFPHLYGTTPESRYLPWGQGTDIGYERARSNNAEVALRGISLWQSPITRPRPRPSPPCSCSTGNCCNCCVN